MQYNIIYIEIYPLSNTGIAWLMCDTEVQGTKVYHTLIQLYTLLQKLICMAIHV